MKFRPLHDRVVVRRTEEDVKTAGGIIIPDTAKEQPTRADVIAVGPGVRDEIGKIVPLSVKKGDRVLFGKWSGTEVKIDGEELLIMKGSDILGVIEGKASVRRGLIAAKEQNPISANGTPQHKYGSRPVKLENHPWQPKM